MQLGAFSISLAVKDIEASAAFYEKLGFSKHGGDLTQNWLILKNGEAVVGLFQGMFEQNALTFNPGWNQDAQELNSYTDVREAFPAAAVLAVPYPLLIDVTIVDGPPVTVLTRTRFHPELGTGRPEEVVAALGRHQRDPAILADRDVVLLLEAEHLRVERDGLVLIVDHE